MVVYIYRKTDGDIADDIYSSTGIPDLTPGPALCYEQVIISPRVLTQEEKTILDIFMWDNGFEFSRMEDTTPPKYYVVLKSPDGSQWRISISDIGMVSAEKIEESNET